MNFKNKVMKKTLFILAVGLTFFMGACGSNAEKEGEHVMTPEEFEENRPFESGTYQVNYYDITGENERKGHFDGRMLASLDPEVGVLYFFENGNRAKIKYRIILDKPFEKGEDGIYVARDKDGNLVIVSSDSTSHINFKKNDSKIRLDFDIKPINTQPAKDVLDKIYEMADK